MLTPALFVVLAAAKCAAVIAGGAPLSIGACSAYFAQDAALALGFLLWERAIRWRYAQLAAYLLLAMYTAANVAIVGAIGAPLTAPMLRASGPALDDSVGHHLTAELLLPAMAVAAAALLLPRIFRACYGAHAMIIAITGLAAIVVAGMVVSTPAAGRGFLRTPVVALCASLFPRLGEESCTSADWRASPIEVAALTEDLRTLRGVCAGRDVVIIVLESTGAKYLRPYGAASDPMPNLSRVAGESLLFENAYAAYPESVKSLVALLASRHPAIDLGTATYAAAATPTIATVLGSDGYRTGLFHSGLFDYLGMREVLSGFGFDAMEDAQVIRGGRRSSFGVDDRDAAARLLRWIDEMPPTAPYLAVFLPISGHHPYGAPEAGPFPAHEEFDAYLNALHYADKIFAYLLEQLRARGRLSRTLVAVVGDHGEAFEQHPGNIGHTFCLYEENVRVPLFIAAPGVEGFARRVARIASHTDLAPTLLALLGKNTPAAFDGCSLLVPAPRLALFATDYSLPLLGLRDGPWKFIHEVGSARSELYDLCVDPREAVDLALSYPTRVARYRAHLIGWGSAERALWLGAALNSPRTP